jgi:hypothetical protein
MAKRKTLKVSHVYPVTTPTAAATKSNFLQWSTLKNCLADSPGVGEKYAEPKREVSSTVADVDKALVLRSRSKIHKLAKEHRQLMWKARRAMDGIRRSLRLKEKLEKESQAAKISSLLQEAGKLGVTDITLNSRYGWITVEAWFGKTRLKGHIWSDLRGPVLDFTEAVVRMPTGKKGDHKPLIRIKAFSKLYIENRTLDLVLDGGQRSIGIPFLCVGLTPPGEV